MPDALPPDAPRVLLSTGKLVGEGFDHPLLDTLVLAMPISWKGALAQYAGRLHRRMGQQIPATAGSDNLNFNSAPDEPRAATTQADTK